jgi:hypothetical protein
MSNLVITLWQSGERLEALKMMRVAAESRIRVLGSGHPDTIASRQALEQMLAAMKQARDELP